MFKMLKGYRTVLLNLAAVLLAVVDYLDNDHDLLAIAFGSPERAAIAAIVLGTTNVALRFITTTPVGRKSAAPSGI